MVESRSRVSIIIPTYNRARLLPAALESALGQTYLKAEVIVVDDGSTDETPEVLGRYVGRLKVVRQENKGVAAARNTGIRVASGDYICFLDDDDAYLPEKIERQVEVLDRRHEVGLVHSEYFHADQGGQIIDRMRLLPEGRVLSKLVLDNFIWVGAPLVRRECFERAGLFDEQIPAISADWDLWLRIATAGYLFACIQAPLGVYRLQPDSMLSKATGLEAATFTILDRLFSLPELPAGVKRLKDIAYGKWRSWIGWRYATLGAWQDASRNFEAAIRLCPDPSGYPSNLIESICEAALDGRVADPLFFVEQAMRHLPAVFQVGKSQASQLWGLLYLRLALRAFADACSASGRSVEEKISQAQRDLSCAFTFSPALVENADRLNDLIVKHAMLTPQDPLLFVEMVFDNLPSWAHGLSKLRRRVIADVSVNYAFEEYANGLRAQAARRISKALVRRPGWIRNKGVLSILVRSVYQTILICLLSLSSFPLTTRRYS